MKKSTKTSKTKGASEKAVKTVKKKGKAVKASGTVLTVDFAGVENGYATVKEGDYLT